MTKKIFSTICPLTYCIKYQRDTSASVILIAMLTLFYQCDKIPWQIQCVERKEFVGADGSIRVFHRRVTWQQ